MLINNNLKEFRENLEMTQEELGYVLGITKGTVANWENSNDSIPLRQIIKLCNIYNTSIDYILGISRYNKTYSKIGNIDKKKLGNNIKSLRIKNNYSQFEFAELCSIAQSTLSLYETGQRLINTLTLKIICTKFNISADVLFGRK